MLKLVKTGVGGYIQVDSSCNFCPKDSLNLVQFPNYTPPANISGMLYFISQSDYENYIKAANLMEDLWIYSNIDFEDTPDEIYHLGEESLNAIDSLFAFRSLRGLYELNDFNNHEWRDTAAIYIEDDDMQIVLNELNEVKIGDKFYKYVSNNIMAEINDNLPVLDSVRVFGIFTQSPNIKYYDEESAAEITPDRGEIVEGTQSCAEFQVLLNAHVSSYISPTAIKWSLNTRVSNPVTGTRPNRYRDVKGIYTINWGDGTIENFVGELGNSNYYYHIYQYPQSGFINRTITVSFTLIQQQNPSTGYLEIINNCPNLTTSVLSSFQIIELETFNYPDCLTGRIIREFVGDQRIVNGKTYRVECKLKQVTERQGFIILWQQPKIAATIVFRKLKNGKWKKTKSLEGLTLNLRGNVYENYNCASLFYTINETKTKNKKKKIKFVILGKLGTQLYFPSGFRTSKTLPTAISADYIWTYNNGQTVVGKYNEVLKP